MRRSHAGPPIPTPDAQLQGLITRRLALLPHRGDWQAAGVWGAADDFLVPLRVAPAVGAGGANSGGAPESRHAGPVGAARLPRRRDWLHVQGAEVVATRRMGDELELRLLRASDEEGPLGILVEGRPAEARVIDLIGTDLGPLEPGRPLRPWQILTVRLHP
jgi:hypothetical protein